VHEAFSRLSRRLHALDLPDGLTNERLSTLATIAHREPIAISALAEAEIVSLPTMSNMVTKLVADGLVKRASDESDGRGVLVSTTAKGSKTYQRATQQSLTHLISALGAMQQQQLATIRMLLSNFDGSNPVGQPSELERLYAIAPVGLAYFNKDLQFIYINEWLARINGLSVEAHLGKTVAEVVPHVAEGIVPQLRVVLQTGEPIIDGRVEAETPAHPGESRQYLHNYYPDVSEGGTVVGVSCVVQDISERLKQGTGNGKSSQSET